MAQALSQEVEIINKLGLHARAAAKLVSTASRFPAEITIRREDRDANAKSIMRVMMLAASCGSVIEVQASGEDAEEALAAVVDLIADRFGEPE